MFLSRFSLIFNYLLLVMSHIMSKFGFAWRAQPKSLLQSRNRNWLKMSTNAENTSPPPVRRHPTQTSRRDGMGKPKGYANPLNRYTLEKHTLSGLPPGLSPICSSSSTALPSHSHTSFTVLGIESSCDDTGVAIVRSDGTILSNIVMSQHNVHAKFGGVVPSLAMEAHK